MNTAISIQLRCTACGGDLRGCDVFGLCAECHRPVSETIRAEALDEATLAIREDVACAGCGYNLRTLALDAKCPECARDVADSLARNELHLADVKWLRRIQTGMSLLLASMFLVVCNVALISVCLVFFRQSAPLRNAIGGVLSSVSLALFVAGVWLLFDSEKKGSVFWGHKSARLLIVLWLILWFGQLVVPGIWTVPNNDVWYIAVQVSTFSAFVVLQICCAMRLYLITICAIRGGLVTLTIAFICTVLLGAIFELAGTMLEYGNLSGTPAPSIAAQLGIGGPSLIWPLLIAPIYLNNASGFNWPLLCGIVPSNVAAFALGCLALARSYRLISGAVNPRQ